MTPTTSCPFTPAGAGRRTQALNGEHIAVAYAATVHAKPHMTGLQPEQLALHQFKVSLPGDLKSAIRRHAKAPFGFFGGVRPRTG